MTEISESRALAERLAACDDTRLARMLDEYRVTHRNSWRDFFDAADELLSPEQVRRAVSRQPRDVLATLVRGLGQEEVPGLTLPDGTPYRAAQEAIGEDLPDPNPPSLPQTADEASAAHAAERTFTTAAALADVLLTALRRPLVRIGAGAVGSTDRKRMVEDEIARDAAEADLLVSLGESAGLLRPDERRWLVTRSGAQWVREPTARRWAILVRGLRDALPSGLRTSDGGWIDPALWRGAYPLDDDWPARAERLVALLQLAGLMTADGAEPPWTTPVRSGNEPDPAPLLSLLPAEVDRVFLQNDLTAIAPGPLRPELDVRLRGMTIRESHAQASTYRFTESSLTSALSEGETAGAIREFLEGLTLTGIPQPLDYLIERTARRHGLVRVSRDITTGQTYVSSRDHDVVSTIAVDQALKPLGLVPDGRMLRSRASRSTVYWSLADARYPVVAIDDDGLVVQLDRHLLAPADDDVDPLRGYAPLIARLREAQGPDADRAWLERELDAAVRSRATITIEVGLPDGSTRNLTLEATGMGGGRLRGADRTADVERTLPLSSIRSVRSTG